MTFEKLSLARKQEIALNEYTKAEIEAMSLSALNEIVQEYLYCFEELEIQRKNAKDKNRKGFILYDNFKENHDVIDRYTLVLEAAADGVKHFFGMSTNPLSANGFNQFVGTSTDGIEIGEHLGTVIALEDVSKEVQTAIQKRIETLEYDTRAKKFKMFSYND